MTTDKSPARRVLVVDDEALMRWWMAETLTVLGYAVIEAADARHALRAIADVATPVHVILLDYHLPDSRDLTLLATIRRVAPGSPVIMMTIHGPPDVPTGALALGAHCVLHKPFDMRELVDAVQGAYRRSLH